MTVIDGVNVAVYECEECGGKELWLFRGQDGQGYKISCANCKKEQRELVTELKIPYLWKHMESTQEGKGKWNC